MKAADVMTRQLITIDPDSSVAEAARRMLENRISGLPVVDAQGRLVGIVSEGDLLHRAETGTAARRHRRSWWLMLVSGPSGSADEYVKSHSRKVRDVMTQHVVSVDESTPLDEVVHLLESRRIKRVPVLREQQLVGIVSRANLVQALASVATDLTEPTADDRMLRDRVLAEFEGQPWAPRFGENVIVQNGVVHLWGAVSSETQRQALRVAAENVPGVKGVEDHIDVVNPVADGAIAW